MIIHGYDKFEKIRNVKMDLLGIIGGLGPMATAYFMQLITEMTDAVTDQEHLRMVIFSAPDIPDRTEYIIGKSDNSPLPGIIEAGLSLKRIGADVIAIPCITAHYFQSDIENGLGITTLNVIAGCCDFLAKLNVKKVGLMATEGTVKSNLFQREFKKKGITVLIPEKKDQDIVTSLIYNDVKKGRDPDMSAFYYVKNRLLQSGAEIVILGCTELSVIKRDNDTGDRVLDAMEVLASMAITACGKKVRKDRCLL